MTTVDEKFKLIIKAKLCPYCYSTPVLRSSKVIYGQSSNFGNIWICTECLAYVGCHPGSNKPLGRLADEDLRYWKKQAHNSFDSLWKYKVKKHLLHFRSARTQAYSWLSELMNIEKDYTHIGMFDIDQCKKVIELCKKEFKRIA